MLVVDKGFIKLHPFFVSVPPMETEAQLSNESFYQRELERFYDDLIDVFWRNHFCFWTKACSYLNEPYIPKPDAELIVFEDVLHADPAYPEPLDELLMCLIERGWKIIMNFMAPDCILGNVAVKLGEKWFAIGQCRKDRKGNPYVAQIWPLKYVLPRIHKMEIKPQQVFSITLDF
jgi:hypothetical protein